MKTRNLVFKTPPVLLQFIQQHGLNFTAASIGISRGALDKALSSSWDSLNRSVIEKICDRFDLDVSDLLKLEPIDFWTPFAESKQCVFVAETISMETPPFADLESVNLYDQQTTSEIRAFLSSAFGVSNFSAFSDITNEGRVINTIKRHNCVVIGSPRSNPATEIILSRYYGARPFDSSEGNRRRVPFAFVWPPNDERGKGSALSIAPADNSRGLGILHKKDGHLIVKVDWIPKHDFSAKIIRNAKDCALIFIIDKPFKTKEIVRTIVLAGYSGIGTLAAAKALIRDFRKLQPIEEGRSVGVVEIRYRKTREAEDHREIEKYYWKLIRGERTR